MERLHGTAAMSLWRDTDASLESSNNVIRIHNQIFLKVIPAI